MISGQRPPSDWASAHVVTRGGAPVAVDIELALSMGATIATGIIMPSMLFIERFLLPKRVRCHTERTIVAQPGPVTIPSKAPYPLHGPPLQLQREQSLPLLCKDIHVSTDTRLVSARFPLS